MGEKLAPMLRYFACGDKLVTLMRIVNQFGARMKRVSPVGSCRMTLRVLFAGAVAALPLLVSGALAQTAATPPAAATSPAPSANSASPAAAPTSQAPPAQIPASPAAQVPANQPAATATSAPPANP